MYEAGGCLVALAPGRHGGRRGIVLEGGVMFCAAGAGPGTIDATALGSRPRNRAGRDWGAVLWTKRNFCSASGAYAASSLSRAEFVALRRQYTCIEVRCGGHLLIFDAGTGLRELGNSLNGGRPAGRRHPADPHPRRPHHRHPLLRALRSAEPLPPLGRAPAAQAHAARGAEQVHGRSSVSGPDLDLRRQRHLPRLRGRREHLAARRPS